MRQEWSSFDIRENRDSDVKQIAGLSGPHLKLDLPVCTLYHCIQLPHCLLLTHFYTVTRKNSITLDQEMISRNYILSEFTLHDSVNLPPQLDVTGVVPWRVSYHRVPPWILTAVCCSEGAGSRGHYSGHSLLYYKTMEDLAVPCQFILTPTIISQTLMLLAQRRKPRLWGGSGNDINKR